MSHSTFATGRRVPQKAPRPEGRTQRSCPLVENCINFKEGLSTLKFWPELLDVKYAGTRMVQFRHEGRRLPILWLVVETQQMLLPFKLDVFL